MSLLLIEKEGRVLSITLNRPEKRNAFNIAMCHELLDAIANAQSDPGVGSILLTAAGRVFSAGMDLDEASSETGDASTAIHERLFSIGRETSKPIIACVTGPALGGGLGLVAQSQVAVAAQGALFGLTEIRSGIWPFLVYRSLEAAIGPRRTLELSLTGRLFSTHEALSWGLIHQVAHAFEVEDRAGAIARDIAKASPEAVRLGLEYVNRSRNKTWCEAGILAAELRRECTSGADFKEGVAAFHEHRESHWPSMPEGTYSDIPEHVDRDAPLRQKTGTEQGH
ncbi:MAG: enoyl-CoA hydratase/isomerase family protein [Bryobacteraceae bacterium]